MVLLDLNLPPDEDSDKSSMAGGGGEVGKGGGDGRGDDGASRVAVDTVHGRGRYGLTGRGLLLPLSLSLTQN